MTITETAREHISKETPMMTTEGNHASGRRGLFGMKDLDIQSATAGGAQKP